MARRKTRTLTEVELEFMQVLWTGGEMTTEEVRERLGAQGRDLADGSIRKVLSILVDKGYLVRRREGRGFLYRSEVPESQASRSMVMDLLRRVFGGSAALMVAALLDSHAVPPKDLEQIRRLIAKHEGEKMP